MTTLRIRPGEVGPHAQHHPAKRESKLRKSHTDPTASHLDLTGIASGRAQAQHALSAMAASAEYARNRRHRPDARIEAGLNFLSFDEIK